MLLESLSRRSLRRFILLVVLLGLMGGCGVRFVYNQLDWLVPWYLDDYIELDGQQKKLFKIRLEQYLAWHRREQLPLYAEFLDGVALQAARGFTREDIAAAQQRANALAQAMVDRLQPDMAALFATATDEQVEQLFRKFAEDDARQAKAYRKQDARERQRAQAEEAGRFVERWTGSLDRRQQKMIRQWARHYEPMDEEVAATRLAWQQEFRRLLALRRNPVAWESGFKALLANPAFGRSQALQGKLERNEAALISLYLQLDKTLSADQRQKMVKKLQRYAADFRQLSRQ